MTRQYMAWTGILLLSVSLSVCDRVRRDPGSFDPDYPQIRTTEVLRLGGARADGATALGSVAAVALLPQDGGIAIADGMSGEILLFDFAGNVLDKVGGEGAGPGEFGKIQSLSSLPDGRLLVWDIQYSRVTVFDTTLAVGHVAAIDFSFTENAHPHFVGALPSGTLLFRDQRPAIELREEREGMREESIRLITFDSLGNPTGTVVELRDTPHWLRNKENAWGLYTPIFGRDLAIIVAGDQIIVGPNNAKELDRLNVEGSLLGSLAVPPNPRRVSRGEVEAERQRRIDSVPTPTIGTPGTFPEGMLERFADRQREALDEVPALSSTPAFDQLIGTLTGEVWMREYPLPHEDPVRWYWIDGGGTVKGQLFLPSDVEILDGDDSVLILRERDEFLADVVSVHRILLR